MSNIDTNPYKSDFPLLKNNKDLAFLDSAATAQRPACVLDAQRTFYETMNANALRGLYSLSAKATAAINEARKKCAEFIGVAEPSKNAREIIFCRNTSEALNLVAKTYGAANLKAGDEVCISIMEHHSNLIPWQQACRATGAKLVYMFPDAQGQITQEEIDAKINENTKIVSITHVSNVLGVKTPIEAITKRAHACGAVVVVDGAQSAPHIKVNVAALDCDFYAFSAHKAFGPFGIGVLWGRAALLEEMPPHLTGGEMIDSVTQTSAVWAPIPEKFEAGTQDAAGIYATGAAIDYINKVGIDNIAAREAALMEYMMSEISALPFVRIIGPMSASAHHGALSFNVCGIHPHDVASILDTCNVAIRAGHHCAQPLLDWMGIDSCCRASVAFYNDARDIDTLVTGLKKVWEMFNGAQC